MYSFVKQSFLKIKDIIPETVSSTTASAANNFITCDSTTYSVGPNALITLVATTGNTWIDPTGTATTNSFKLTEGDDISLQIEGEGTLSIVSDSTTAKIQAIIWK
jgi:hypothetical protein